LDLSIKALIGDDLNINSPRQLADYFFRKEGLAPVKMGKTHESVDVSVLEQLKHPLAEQLVSYRKKFKLANTYVAPMLEMLDSNGRLHCSYNQVGAKTGRMSCSDPNLQNIPSDRETSLIRRAFVSDSGMVFFDYSGMEARVFAHYCNDTHLINAYNANLDPYIMVGASIFELPYDEVVSKLEAGDSEAKNMRYIGKTTFLSTIYGVGKKRLSGQLDVGMDEAESFLKSFFKLYPKIKPFVRTISDQVKVNGYIETLAGRYRRLEFKDNYKGVNALIQGTATGDMLKASLVKTHEALKETGGALSLVIHDEVAIEGLPKEGIPVIKSVLEDFKGFKVPIPVDVSISEYSWADKKEVSEV
jgi:DNA polymerase-1